ASSIAWRRMWPRLATRSSELVTHSRCWVTFSQSACYIARYVEARARLFRNAVSAADGFSHASRLAAARAGDPGPLGKGRSPQPVARTVERTQEIYPTRRSTLCERQHPHRARSQ